MPDRSLAVRFDTIQDKIRSGSALRMVFVNDCGFIAGAGMAQRRQASAMLALGHDVGVVCSLDNQSPPPPLRGKPYKGEFLGITALPHLNARETASLDPARISSEVVERVRAYQPDIAIVGNLHWTGWPVTLPTALTDAGIPTACYFHDCHFFTGRCVYPSGCERFHDHCDQRCPTPEDYPPLDPLRISQAHQTRKHQFAQPHSIPIATNSRWTVDTARRGLGPDASISLVPLGLDEKLFEPIDQPLARRLLGLPHNIPIMLFGATDLGSQTKGGPFMQRVCQLLDRRPELMMCAFGHNSNFIRGVRGVGHVDDERLMPLLFSACDFYASFSKDETFGQTSMEAAACERPIVCRRSGGIVDIAQDGINARVIHPDSEERFAQACIELAQNRAERLRLGKAGRDIVLRHHSTEQSGRALEQWMAGLATGTGATDHDE